MNFLVRPKKCQLFCPIKRKVIPNEMEESTVSDTCGLLNPLAGFGMILFTDLIDKTLPGWKGFLMREDN